MSLYICECFRHIWTPSNWMFKINTGQFSPYWLKIHRITYNNVNWLFFLRDTFDTTKKDCFLLLEKSSLYAGSFVGRSRSPEPVNVIETQSEYVKVPISTTKKFRGFGRFTRGWAQALVKYYWNKRIYFFASPFRPTMSRLSLPADKY